MKILVVNAGSTSLKYKLFSIDRDESVLSSGKVERIGSSESLLEHKTKSGELIKKSIGKVDYNKAVQEALNIIVSHSEGSISSVDEISAIGFKTVHAGEKRDTAFLDKEIIDEMEKFRDAAPLHNKFYIEVITQFRALLPDTPLVGVFETSFHATIPDYAYIYSFPYEWYENHGIRKYGFHSASFRYIVTRLPHVIEKPLRELKIIACHLGGSSSVCAISDGKSIDTSMGFTLQAGLPMSTRCGDVDPYALLVIQEREKKSTSQLSDELCKNSGLLGISGISGDVRDLEVAASEGNSRARLALNIFTYQVKKYIGAYAAVLGGVDVLVFSGGIGENAFEIRNEICNGLEFLGITLDQERNRLFCGKEGRISKKSEKVEIWVIPTNEELIVARETYKLVKENGKNN